MEFSIVEKKQIAQDTTEVSFASASGLFEFLPGQHIELTLDNPPYTDTRGNSRTFSIASSPHEEKLSIAFRHSDSAFKKSLHTLPLGSPVSITGPFGFFTLPDSWPGHIVLIAGGIGITPFVSMLRSAAHNNNTLRASISLLYANTSEERMAYKEELKNIALANNLLTIRFHRGILDEDACKEITNNAAYYYVAGPPHMVSVTSSILQKKGVERKKLLLEEFTGWN